MWKFSISSERFTCQKNLETRTNMTIQESLRLAVQRNACEDGVKWFRNLLAGRIDKDSFDISWLRLADKNNCLPECYTPILVKYKSRLHQIRTERKSKTDQVWTERKSKTNQV